MRTTKETERSIWTALLQLLIRPFGKYMVSIDKEYPAGSVRCTAPRYTRARCAIEEESIEELWVYNLTRKTPPSDVKQTKRIYYFAGGGWQMPPSPEHWQFASALAEKCPEAVVSLVSHPLAPKSAAPVALPQLSRWFTSVTAKANEDGEDLIMVGDSSGGNIVLSVALSGLHEVALPTALKKLVVISPTVDLSHSNPDEKLAERNDPLHSLASVNSTASAWSSEWDKKDPRISPLYADLSILKKAGIKVYGVTGGYDVLAPDALLLRDRLEEEQVEGEWLEWDKQIHCFPLAFKYKFPESVRGFDWLVDKIKEA